MNKRHLLTTLALVTACGGGSSQRADTAAADTVLPEPPPAVQPDTQPRIPTVTIATDRKSYRAGDPVELRVVNETGNGYTYNPCTRIVERQTDSTWTAVKEERICTMIAHMLEPNASRVERTELGEELPPGTYRILVRFAPDTPAARARPIDARSEPITVTL